ncbi:hypothetical protein GCM10010103_65360 [Streptomyces paradoxus]|uniref:hypothetical protein n=1 Tax=Streptomyces paradoxus TaxID=66375 RepID=UPI001616831C|nr:hypothetical protein [Streptomyces paradoxus]
MWRPDRGTLRSAGFVLVLTSVFVLVNSQVVYAAGSNSETGDLLAPLNIASSEGVAINGYELNAEGGSIVSFKTQSLSFALGGLFTLIRLLVGLAGWAIEVAFRFPLLKILTRPAQEVADAYNSVVVDSLGLKGLLLAWAFVFAGFMIVRGRMGRGLGEVFLTLLIAAFAASTFVRPDYLLAQDGPLGQGQAVAAEVAQQSVASYDWGGKIASRETCDGLAGNAEIKCLEREGERPVSAEDVARPIQDSVTNALVVKPYMLLQYGRILDPAKDSDRKAYAVHLKWITGGYKASEGTDGEDNGCDQLAPPLRSHCEEQNEKEDNCRLLRGPARESCERDTGGGRAGNSLPELTPGGELLDASNAIVTDEDREFHAFLQDMRKAGDVGKACAAYAEEPTWWRVGGAVLLLIAALFICGMLLSSAIVLLGTQGVCAAAAAAGGVTFVAGMLPGPARQSVWKWLSLWGIAVLAVVGICAFVPFFGIAVDAVVTDGPDLMVERILLIDVLAIAGAAGHRRLLTGIASFGRRMAMRMRYAKVGGTHLPGDTSELGAALAMNSPAAMGGYGGGLRSFTGGGGGRFGLLGTRQRLMNALTSLVDGAGMPVDTGRMLADATAEAGRGLAPLSAAAAVGGLGARIGAKSGHWLLIGRRPGHEQLAKWLKPTGEGEEGPGGPSGAGEGGSGSPGPQRPAGPPDRYRNEEGQIVDPNSGQVLHDQNTDRTLLATRAHNRLARFRGYRILHRGGRVAYGATYGLPASVRRARGGGSRYAQDARQQVRVWGNTWREDGRAWADTGRHVSRVLRENPGDGGGHGPTGGGRRLPAVAPSAAARPAAAPRPTTTSGGATARMTPSSPRSSAPAPRAGTTAPARLSPAPRRRLSGGAASPPAQGAGDQSAPSAGADTGSGGRNVGRARMNELMRQATAIREMREQWQRDDRSGEDE